MKFSIITPSFNQLPFLKRCVASVADQAGVEIEHILIDGGSSDGTVEYLRKMASEERGRPGYEFRFVSEKDAGMYDALNKGIRKASGDLVAWLNCDEQYLPGALQKIAEVFEANPRADFAYGDVLLIDEQGDLLTYRKNPPLRKAYILADHFYVHSASMFFRKRIFDAGVLFNTDWKAVGDAEWIVRVLSAGYRPKQVRRSVAVCSMTGENLSRKTLGIRELRELRREALLRFRFARSLYNAARYLEKAVRGGYVYRGQFEYEIYVDDNTARSRKVIEKVCCRFRWGGSEGGRQLVVVGQTPPPFNGQAKMIQQMLDGLSEELSVIHIRMAYSDSVVGAGRFQLKKVAHLFSLIKKTREALRKYPGSVLYYPPASPNMVPVLRDLVYLCAVRPLAGKTVFHFHSGGLSQFAKRHRWLMPLFRKAYGAADLAIELGESCPRDGEFFKATRVAVVPNGVDVPVREIVRPTEKKCLNILYVGIHAREKGLFDLLEIGAELMRRGVEFRIRTAGLWYDDDEAKEFDRRRGELNLTESVQCCGRKTGEELWELYEWADVFLFPTSYRWETFGIVQLEAMAFELPVVASDWAGPKDVVVDGETGFLCPPHDVSAFADALEKLSSDSELRLRVGQAGRVRYHSEFTAEIFVNRLKDVLSEVLK
jgi:glycosyltransferase involved in cell wall biosynthesis